MEDEDPEYDLGALAFGDWVKFVFDRPAKAGDEKEWFWTDEFEKFHFKSDLLLLKNITHLLRAPEILIEMFSTEKIEQGFNCLEYAFEWSDLLREKELPLDLRVACILEVTTLYERLLSRNGLRMTAYMLWDLLAYDYHMRDGVPLDDDDSAVQNAMFESLSKIVRMPQRICLLAGMHGLGHLKHPKIREVLRSALEGRTELLEGDLEYAEHCMKGTMDTTGGPQFPDETI